MKRPVLEADKISPEALTSISGYHQNVVKEVSEAVSNHKVVIVGMAQNPYVKKVRKALTEAGIDFKYLEYGNYWSKWKPRLAIKLWSGWPTYPQVFVEGKLIGGYQETKKALQSGKITR